MSAPRVASKRRWIARTVRAIAWTLAVLLVLRVVLWLALPKLVDLAVEPRGLACTWRDLDLSLLTGEVELRDLRVRDRALPPESAAEPLVALDYLQLDLDVWKSIFQHPSIARCEVDGLRARLEVLEDGSVPLEHYLGLDQPSAQTLREPEHERVPLDFTAPVALGALRLNQVELHCLDATAEPPIDVRVVADARLDGFERTRHRFELRATSRELFDLIRVEAELEGGPRSLAGRVRFDASSLRPDGARTWLERLGCDVPARELAARSELELALMPRAGSPFDCIAELRVHDTGLRADGDLIVAIDSLAAQIGSLEFEQPGHADLTLEARAPRIAETLRADGTLDFAHSSASAAFELQADGVTLARLAPILRASGLSPTLENGRLRARVEGDATFDERGRIAGNAKLAGVNWSDGTELFALDEAALGDFTFDPANALVCLGDVELSGMRAAARREADGSLRALGFEIVPGAAATPVESATTSDTGPPPRVELGRLAWRDNRLAFYDASSKPPLDLRANEFELELERVAFGGDPLARPVEPARVHARVALEGALDELVLDGTLALAPQPLDLDARLALRAKGVHPVAMREHLAALGIEPTLADGALAFDLAAHVRDDAGELESSLAVEHLELSDGEHVLAGLDALRVENVRFASSGLRIARVVVTHPALAIERDEHGALVACGLRFVPQPPPPPASDPWEALFSGVALPALPPIAVESFALEDASLRWRDETVRPAVECAAVLRAKLESLSTSKDAVPARFEFGAAVEGALDDASVRGHARLVPGDLALDATISARGMRAGVLAAYLPPSMRVEWSDGRFDAHVAAEIIEHDGGTRALLASVDRLDLSDGGATLARLERAAVRAPRIDPPTRELDVQELSLAGLRVAAEHSTPTTWRALGCAFESSASEASPAAAAPRAPRIVSTLAPTLRLGRLDLDLAQITVIDRARGAAPLVASARLTNAQPLVLLAPEVRELPPIALKLEGTCEPLVRSFRLELQASPFADAPVVEGALAVRGIRGEGLTALSPEARSFLDGHTLEDGCFDARASLELSLARRSPTQFDLAQPFGARLELGPVEFREREGGEVLAGFESLRADVERIDPSRGDVHVRTLELTKPAGRVVRDSDGLHVLGVVLRATEDGGAGEAPRETREVPAPAVVSASAPASDENAPDLRIDRASISGLDFVARDDSLSPPMVLPLDSLELEVHKFSTRSLRAGRPVQFSLSLGAGAVDLPAREESDSLLEGVATATAAALSGDGECYGKTRRPLFDEIALAGRVAFSPEPSGWATLDVSALELQPFRALSEGAGLTVGDGVLDESVRVRLQGARGLSIESKSVFSHLSLSEPADGPIQRYLALPAPLDTVLFLLKDYEGEHKVPVSFRVEHGELGSGEIAEAATGAAASVIASAVASSPLRIAGTLTDMLGLTGGEQPAANANDRRVPFDAGAAALSVPSLQAVTAVAQTLARRPSMHVLISHEFSAGDFERAAQLANPALDDCRQLSLRLRNKCAQLERDRGELAAQTRAEYAVGELAAAKYATERLRALDAEIGLTEDALDRLHDLFEPSAGRKREQRTRTAALAIASQRIEQTRQALIQLGVAPERIEVRQIRVGLPTGREQAPGGGAVLLAPRRRHG